MRRGTRPSLRTGLSHAQVNAELDRKASLRCIAEATATVAELETRFEKAERGWRRSEDRPLPSAPPHMRRVVSGCVDRREFRRSSLGLSHCRSRQQSRADPYGNGSTLLAASVRWPFDAVSSDASISARSGRASVAVSYSRLNARAINGVTAVNTMA